MTGPLDHVNLTYVSNIDDVSAFIDWIKQPRDILGVDTETGGFNPFKNKLRLVQLGDADAGWAIPWHLWSGLALNVLRDYRRPIVLHNSQFDVRFLTVHGGKDFGKWDWTQTHDTMTMAHLIDSNAAKGLKPLAGKLIDPKAVTAQRSLSEGMSTNKWTWDTVPLDFPPYWIYAALDPVLTCHLHRKMAPIVEANYRKPYELEVGTLEVVTNMMLKGVKIDLEYCEEKKGQLDQFSKDARAFLFEQYGIENATSMLQIQRALEAEGITLMDKKTKGGSQAMDKEVLVAADHEISNTVLEIKRADKLSTTYFSNLIAAVDDNNRVHPTIWAQGTKTSRMTITEPALQTLPKKSPVRGAFIPAEGNALISIDADQIEARLTAHFAMDEGMAAAFTEGDFFVNIARGVFNDASIEKDDPRRQLTKGVVYGKLYGAGVAKMAETAHVPVEQMAVVVDAFERAFPGVLEVQNATARVAKQRGRTEGRAYIKTHLGRPITVEDDKEYTAMNYLIQGTAAEVFKSTLLRLVDAGYGDYLMIPVHDEIVMEAPAADAEEIMHDAVEVMNDFETFALPITWSGDVMTKSWNDKYGG